MYSRLRERQLKLARPRWALRDSELQATLPLHPGEKVLVSASFEPPPTLGGLIGAFQDGWRSPPRGSVAASAKAAGLLVLTDQRLLACHRSLVRREGLALKIDRRWKVHWETPRTRLKRAEARTGRPGVAIRLVFDDESTVELRCTGGPLGAFVDELRSRMSPR